VTFTNPFKRVPFHKKHPRITVDQYLKTHNSESVEYITALTTGPGIVEAGFLFWNPKDNPESWGGPWEGNMVLYRITDHTKTGRPLKTTLQLWEEWKNYETRTNFNYPRAALARAGMSNDYPNNQYWVRPYVDDAGVSHPDQLCTYSEMTDEEIAKVRAVMTGEEIVETEITQMRDLASEDRDPRRRVSVEKPFSLKFFGNDDCSYEYAYNPRTPEAYITPVVHMMLDFPRWNWIEKYCKFTN
jgi:hypothetical protein